MLHKNDMIFYEYFFQAVSILTILGNNPNNILYKYRDYYLRFCSSHIFINNFIYLLTLHKIIILL